MRRSVIRENTLKADAIMANPVAQRAIQLSETNRRLVVKDLTPPIIKKSVDEIMKERLELDDREVNKIIVPAKYMKILEK